MRVRVSEETEFKKLYMGEFKPDPRMIALVERLEQYYRDTPDNMGNNYSVRYW